MKIGFAIIPEKSFLEEMVRVENEIHDKFGFRDRLGIEHNLPHITLFQGYMDENMDYVQMADATADKIRSMIPQREIRFQNVVYVPRGWYFRVCLKTPELSAVHACLLSLVDKYIILDPKRMDLDPTGLTDAQIKGIEEYGYRFAGEAFYPHITVGRDDGRDENVLKRLNAELLPQKTHIEKVTVYRMGHNGTHEDTLYETVI